MTYTSWVVHCPLPPRELSPNSGAGRNNRMFHVKRHAAAEYRGACRIEFENAIRATGTGADGLPFERARCRTTLLMSKKTAGRSLFGKTRYRPTDPTNAVIALKPLYDALQDAGFIVDDAYPGFRAEMPEFDYVQFEAEEGVVVMLEVMP